MAVRIRMKRLGRKHRPYFRICAVDPRSPRDGRVIEELGTYDPMVSETDARVVMNHDRVAYWLGVGAKPSEHVRVFLRKYGPSGTRLKEQEQARARLAMPRIVPPSPKPVWTPEQDATPPAAEAPVTEVVADGGAPEGGEAAPAAE